MRVILSQFMNNVRSIVELIAPVLPTHLWYILDTLAEEKGISMHCVICNDLTFGTKSNVTTYLNSTYFMVA